MSLLALLLLLAAPATPDCRRAVTQPELNACADEELKRADDRLNRQWRLVVARLERQGELDRLQRLREAQRAWLVFRDAHCDSLHFPDIGASLDYTQNLWCRTELTIERTEQLADLAKEP
jgi:uncharacterized protein YecT (DUF1311 family)